LKIQQYVVPFVSAQSKDPNASDVNARSLATDCGSVTAKLAGEIRPQQ
jgi:hypothetical protein